MVYRDPRCVYVAEDLSQAMEVVNWLGHHCIQARVMNESTMGGLDGLSLFSTRGVSSRGIEVWALDEKQVARAAALLNEHEETLVRRQDKLDDLGPVEAECEECGQFSTFPGDQRGTVQDCPHCGQYLDVPGGIDDFDWSDVQQTDPEP